MKRHQQDGIGFEPDGEEHAQRVATVDFKYPDEIEVADPDHPAPGPTRDEADAKLKESGLSAAQRRVVLSRTFDKKSLREIAREEKKSKTWVANILKRLPTEKPPIVEKEPTVNDGTKPGAMPPLRPTPLWAAIRNANVSFARYLQPADADLGHLASGVADAQLPPAASDARKTAAMIARWPALLTHPQSGPTVAMELSEMLTAAHYGGGEARKSAREALKELTRYPKGNRYPVPDLVLGSESLAILVTVRDLQSAWRKRERGRKHEPPQARLEAVREQFATEVEGFTDGQLRPRLEGDLLESAAWFAECGTGIAAESFIRAWKKLGIDLP